MGPEVPEIKEEAQEVETGPAAIAIGAKGLMTDEDRIALGMAYKFRILGAGGARKDLDKDIDVYPRPIVILEKIGEIWLEILTTADGFARGTDNSLKGFVAEVLAAKGKQRENLFKVIQLIFLKPPGKAISWSLLDKDELPDDCPTREYLLYNMTAPDINKLFDLFSKQNRWQEMLKNIGAVEAVAVRMQMAKVAKLADLRASAARSLTSSARPDGATSTSAGGSAGPASSSTSAAGASRSKKGKLMPGKGRKG